MGETTGIEWTDATWNPWIGCNKVSPGCAHCYAETFVEKRLKRKFEIVRRAAPMTWELPLALERKAIREDRLLRVFTCSLSDFFHPAADEFRREAWLLMKQTPHLTYQILTKRPERIEANLPTDWGTEGWANVWLGTSVESHAYWERVDHLLDVPARIHFLSVEPLLASLRNPKDKGWDIAAGIEHETRARGRFVCNLDWVIVGGESGLHAREMKVDWVREIRDWCQQAGILFFFKQWGGARDKKDHEDAVLDGRRWTEVPT